MEKQFFRYYPVACHTDNIGPGSTYVAIQGDNANGIDFIECAVKKGATQVVIASDVQLPKHIYTLLDLHSIQLSRVNNTRKALAELSAAAVNYPAHALKLLAITGTKGKTTTAWITYHILQRAGKNVALVSTVANKIGEVTYASTLTTPHPDYMHLFFDLCRASGVEYVIIETAAQAHSLYRTHQLEFDALFFTNFSQEHGEFYETMDSYFQAKKSLCDQVKKDGMLILNADDERTCLLASSESITLGFHKAAQYVIKKVFDQKMLNFGFTFKDKEYTVSCPSVAGNFNAYNVTGALILAYRAGIDLKKACLLLHDFVGVPGRMEKYMLSNGALGIVDYAHNPSSYQAVLPVLRSLTDHLIIVFGCGGKRDGSKRPVMGEIASRFADRIILTSDNPRTEDATSICDDIKSGVPLELHKKIEYELDRSKAISHAFSLSRKGSLIAVFGKGPDEYQIVGTTKSFFSDSAILKSL